MSLRLQQGLELWFRIALELGLGLELVLQWIGSKGGLVVMFGTRIGVGFRVTAEGETAI